MAITVTTELLRGTARTFDTETSNIRDYINSIDNQMKSIDDNNESLVLTELRSKFTEFKNASLESYCRVISEYARHLEHVAETYETTETNLISNQANIENQNNALFK